MSSRRPVVTGLGIITAAGCGVSAVWDALRTGRSGLGPLTLFALPRYGSHQVGQVRADVDQLAGDARGSRSDKLAWIAAREAIRQSGTRGAFDRRRRGPGRGPAGHHGGRHLGN